uniref:RRM domain-containing protein n=1 Tax=Araucaria cunninghamii TaxID=56994 RepID=A0A0D6QUR6_ARACU
MSYSRRYDSYSPRRNRSLSRSDSRSLSRSRSQESGDVRNPGNNLYVTGLSPRITKRDLEEHFSKEGTVVECHLVVDPRTRESRGFGFVTMASLEDAERCIKYLNRSVIEGRVITVEKAKRKRGRTPTPGKYLGVRPTRVRDYDRRREYSRSTDLYSSRRSPSYSPYRGDRYGSPYSPYDDRRYGRDRSVSPSYGRRYDDRRYLRDRSVSPSYGRRERSVSPYGRRERSLSPYGGRYRSPSPYGRRRRSPSPYYSKGRRVASPHRRRDRSISPEDSPYRGSRRSYSYRSRNRSRSRSLPPYD